MNKKIKKIIATVSAVAMCATSMISVSADAIGVFSDRKVRTETTSFTATIYGENLKFHLWQEATDYFDNENIKIYICDDNVKSFVDGLTTTLMSYHYVDENIDGTSYDYCTVGITSFNSYYLDNKEDLTILEKYLSENNIAYYKEEFTSGNGGEIWITTHNKINDDEYENIYTEKELFQLKCKIKEDTGFIANLMGPASAIEITSSENVLPEPTLTGDSNEDGEVSIADAILIMQSLVNPDEYSLTPQGIANADMNGDGITTLDALSIQEMLVKK